MASKKIALLLTISLLTYCLFTFTNMQVESHSDPEPYVKVYVWNPATASNVFPAQAYPTPTLVEVWIDSPDAWYDTPNGIVGVTTSLHVDPTVVEVLTTQAMPDLTGIGGYPDSFLGDFLEDAHTFDGFSTAFLVGTVDKPSGNITETAEAILGFTTLGLGAGGGPKPLFRYVIRTQSGVDHTTAYSPITLFNCSYTTVDKVKHPVDIVESGHYGEPPATYDLTIAVDGVGGTTDPVPDVYTYAEGTPVDVTAIPDSGYMLDHWTLDDVDVGTASPYTVTMDADHALTAFFAEIPAVTYDLTIAVDGSEAPQILLLALTSMMRVRWFLSLRIRLKTGRLIIGSLMAFLLARIILLMLLWTLIIL